MTFRHRIEKRKQDVGMKRRRGRPSDWSSSWQKRLIVFRLCGLPLNIILQVLNILGGNTFEAKERRAQQILRGLLSEGYQRLCPSNKLTARRRTAFLRSLGRYDNTTNSKRNRPLSQQINEGSAGSLTTTFIENFELADSFGQVANAAHGAPSILTTDSYEITKKKGAPSLLSNSSSRIRSLLRRDSFSSSFISEMMSVVRKRFSSSTLATSSGCTIFSNCIDDTHDVQDHRDQVFAILEQQKRKIEEANAMLINICCSREVICIHRSISAATELGIGDFASISQRAQNSELNSGQNPAALNSNTALFFAARSGAPGNLIIALLRRGNVNILNDEGQSFLFHLDPRGFHGSPCTCTSHERVGTGVAPHRSNFECLIRRLEKLSFNFDQIDHEGRSFLSYLCASTSFNFEWLIPIVRHNTAWRWRISVLSQCRDSTGTFVIDFIASRLNYGGLGDDMLALFRAEFETNHLSTSNGLRTLNGEDSFGRNNFHNLVQQEGFLYVRTPFQPVKFAGNEDMSCNINQYDCQGRTPLMYYIEKACTEGISQAMIVETVGVLVSWGADINARSRAGRTALHFAAKNALPELLGYVLSIGAELNHPDREGLSALDHAAKTLSKSTKVNTPAEVTARALKCTMSLVDHGAKSAI